MFRKKIIDIINYIKYKKLTDKKTANYWVSLENRIQITKNRMNLEGTSNYEKWIINNEPINFELEEQKHYEFNYNPKISIIVPISDIPINYLQEFLYSIELQTYTNWELCIIDASISKKNEIYSIFSKDSRIRYKFIGKGKSISKVKNEALNLATGDFISFLNESDMLATFALYEVVKCINENVDVEFIYTDEDKFKSVDEFRFTPHFKPDFAIDTLRSYNYINNYMILKKELMDKLNGFLSEYDGAENYDLILRAIENTSKIAHIPKILYHNRTNNSIFDFEIGKLAIESHLKRIGLKGNVSIIKDLSLYKVDYDVIGNPKVTILIPNKDGIDDLKICINSILDKTTYNNYEIVVIENNSEEKKTFEYYDKIIKNDKIKVIFYKVKEFNYSRIINFGVKNTEGEFIIQLNNDTELLTNDWLEKLIGFSQRKDIGAVGVKLYYPDGTIQHAGLISGIFGSVTHVFKGMSKIQRGYFNKENMIQDLSGVTAACIMARRNIYEEVGYMDERYAVAFNDVDFCWKIIDKGYKIVYNPYVELIHYESKTRGYDDTPEKEKRFRSEVNLLINTWKKFIEKGDRYYNKNLSLNSDQYDIEYGKVE